MVVTGRRPWPHLRRRLHHPAADAPHLLPCLHDLPANALRRRRAPSAQRLAEAAAADAQLQQVGTHPTANLGQKWG